MKYVKFFRIARPHIVIRAIAALLLPMVLLGVAKGNLKFQSRNIGAFDLNDDAATRWPRRR